MPAILMTRSHPTHRRAERKDWKVNVRFGPLCGRGSDISRGSRRPVAEIGRIYSISSSAVIGHERVVRIAGVHETVAGLAQITIQLDLGRRSLTVPPPSRPPCRSRWEARRFGAGA